MNNFIVKNKIKTKTVFQVSFDDTIHKLLVSTFLFLLIQFNISAQSRTIDSLRNLLTMAHDSAKVRIMNELSWNYKNSNSDSAIYFSKKAYELALDTEDVQLIAASLSQIGDNYQGIGEYDTALFILKQSIELIKSTNDTTGLSNVYNNIGIIYDEKGAYQQSLNYYFKALRVAEVNSELLLQANILGNIGIVYKKQKDLFQVLKYYNRALIIYKNLEHQFGIAATSGNIGSVLLQLGEFEKSIPHSIDAIDGYKALGFKKYIPYSIGNLGIAYDSLGQPDLAKANYLDAYNQHLSFENRYEAAYNAKNIASLLLRLGDVVEASKYSSRAIILAQEIDAKEMLKDAFNVQAKIKYAMGQYASAYSFKEKYIDLQNELFEQTKTKNIFELQTQYETEKKEQQIATQEILIAQQEATNRLNVILIAGLVIGLLLFVIIALLLRNRMKKKQQLALQQKDLLFKELQLTAIIDSQEKERKRFASDLHDGFGQLISILKLNVENIEGQKDKNKKQFIYQKSLSILDEMYIELRNICFNLMPQSLVKFGLEPSLKEFADKINTSEKLIVEVLIFDLTKRLSDVQEISIYRIVQEWVNNIIKYSDAGKITVQITKDEQELTLTIEDDGMGFELNNLKQSKGNGWKNIRSRTNLIHGDLEIDTTIGKRGNLFLINIPLEQKIVDEAQTSKASTAI